MMSNRRFRLADSNRQDERQELCGSLAETKIMNLYYRPDFILAPSGGIEVSPKRKGAAREKGCKKINEK